MFYQPYTQGYYAFTNLIVADGQSPITLNANNRLDVVSSGYNNKGFTNFTLSINI